MTRYERVQQILEQSVNGDDIGRHGNFWRALTRDQFINKSVFGKRLVEIGNGAASNLVKALKGEAPFDESQFPRMPVGYDPVPDAEIDFIQKWIDDGCPEDEFSAQLLPGVYRKRTLHSLEGEDQTARHLAYWREFDNWALFEATPEVTNAVDEFFGVADRWMAFARDPALEPVWEAATTTATASLRFLSFRQQSTLSAHYGETPDLPLLLDSYERFGDGSFPPDLQRPEDSAHQMNGASMWFFWSAFGDACLRRGVDVPLWNLHLRAILLGQMNDGIFRGRFRVNGFSPDAAGKAAMREHVTSIPDASLPEELRRRYRESRG